MVLSPDEGLRAQWADLGNLGTNRLLILRLVENQLELLGYIQSSFGNHVGRHDSDGTYGSLWLLMASLKGTKSSGSVHFKEPFKFENVNLS